MRRDHGRALAAVDLYFVRLGRSPATRRLVSQAARGLLARRPRRRVAQLDRDDVRAFLAARQAAGISSTTQANELSHLRMFFTTLVKLDLVPTNPTDEIEVERPPARAHRLLSEEEVARLFAASLEVHQGEKRHFFVARAKQVRPTIAPGEVEPFLVACARRDRAALELLYGLGLRASEAINAKVLDLDLTHGTLLVRRAKRGQPDRLPLPPAALPHLGAYLAERPVLARSEDQGRLLLRNDGRPFRRALGMNKLVKRVGRRAGVSVHPHALRRAVATHLIRAGAPILAVQQLLGHAELTSTAIYLEVEREDLRRAIDTLERRAPKQTQV